MDDIFFDVVDIIVKYLFWFAIGLSAVFKLVALNKIKNNLGDDYIAAPPNKYGNTRVVFAGVFFFMGVAALLVTFEKEILSSYAVPLFIISALIYLDGKLHNFTFAFERYDALFVSLNGVMIVPARGFPPLNPRFIRRGEIREVELEGYKLKIKSDSGEDAVSVRSTYVDSYIEALKRFGTDVIIPAEAANRPGFET